MRHTRLAIALAGISIIVPNAARAEERRIAIPVGSLGAAIIMLGRQANLTIGITDPAIAAVRTRGVAGVMTPRAALDRLLAGTGCTYVFIDPRTVRIVRANVVWPTPTPLAHPAPARSRAIPENPIEIVPEAEIVVTASKQGTMLNSFPGTVSIVDLDNPRAAQVASQGTEAIIDRLPVLSSTSLGPGREKLFVRGIADSSFSGPSQATVGQYLGEVRLNYSAPDPDLNLYDISRVEVLEGPQGTLYGTGSLGGIIRIVPNAPNLATLTGGLAGGAVTTEKGGTGGDIAAIANLPIIPDRLAVRAVAYRANNPGYIDDIGRGLKDINRTITTGGRLTLRASLGANWTLDFGGAFQTINVRDGQYAQSDLPPLTRRSMIAQPFDNHYGLGFVTVKKAWPASELVSTTSYVNHRIATTFDATGFPGTAGPVRFDENVATTLLAHETRINGHGETTNWVAGLSLIHSVDRLRRRLGDPATPKPILGVRNVATEGALFGQHTWRISSNLRLTFGGRMNYARATGETLDNPVEEAQEPRRSKLVALPMVGISWQARDRLTLFAQVQQGYRPGGLAIAEAGSPSATQHFDADHITTLEAGLRFGAPRRSSLWGNLTISFARWVDIQSDLIDATGLAFTTNIGDGRIFGLEGSLAWRISPDFTLDGAIFLNKSQLDRPAPLYVAALDRELPNIAGLGGRAGFRYHKALSQKLALTIDGSARYVGTSSLGIGQLLGLDQGGYADVTIGGRLDIGNLGLSLDIRNLGNARGNRFAFGNPFNIAAGNQVTPLRPRTIRIGIDTKF